MIFFLDKNNPSYKAYKKFRETSIGVGELSDQERVKYAEKFLADYFNEYKGLPNSNLLENLANIILKPYIGDKNEEYKILSVYSLERREAKQNTFDDGVRY